MKELEVQELVYKGDKEEKATAKPQGARKDGSVETEMGKKKTGRGWS